MHFICFRCEECFAGFAIESFTYNDDPSCPNCGGSDVTDTGEVIVEPNIMGNCVAKDKGYIA